MRPLTGSLFALAVGALVFAAVVALPSVCHACSCAPSPPPEVAVQNASAVFAGKVLGISQQGRDLAVLFEVVRTWKGARQTQVIVYTGLGGAECGYGFKTGETYLVYAYGTNSLETGICTRTRPISAAGDDLKSLGEGAPPAEPVDLRGTTWSTSRSTRNRQIALPVGAALAGAALISLWRWCAQGTRGRGRPSDEQTRRQSS